MGQASVLMLFAIFCFVAEVWWRISKAEPPAPDVARLPGWTLIGINAFPSLVAAEALHGIWIKGPG